MWLVEIIFFHELIVNSQKKSYKSFYWGGKSNNMYNLGTDMHPLGTNICKFKVRY